MKQIIQFFRIFHQSKKPKHERLGGNNWLEAVKLNGFSISKTNDQRSENHNSNFNEKRSSTQASETTNSGGIIVLPFDENLTGLTKDRIQFVTNCRAEVITIGDFTKGVYQDKNGSIFKKGSTSVEILDVNYAQILSITKQLLNEFSLQCALVKLYSDGSIEIVRN